MNSIKLHLLDKIRKKAVGIYILDTRSLDSSEFLNGIFFGVQYLNGTNNSKTRYVFNPVFRSPFEIMSEN